MNDKELLIEKSSPEIINQNIKNAERLLRQYPSLKASITNLEKQIKELEQDIGVAGTDYSKEKICETYKFLSSTENQATILEQIRQLRIRKEKNERKVELIEEAMKPLNKIERQVIEMFYIERMPYYHICGLIYKSEATAKRIKKVAIKVFAQTLFGE
jgi:DNA-directed RNA polymerase specialized sigma subunit